MTFWERFLANLKINRCPILDPADKAKAEQQARIDRLYPKNQ
ncbi:hypothetical protein SCRES3_gp56 [Synechococcus phage S-CRES3]|nr:hypothetical protein SCRES3_gp56 [Synechococcus phage S-CRES3]